MSFTVRMEELDSQELRLRYPVIADTLDLFVQGKDISESPYVQWGRRTLARNRWFYDCKSEMDILNRQKMVIDLYTSIKTNGFGQDASREFDRKYNRASFKIMVRFDADGRPTVCDGFHRLCILKYLKMLDTEITCEISNDSLGLDTEHTGKTTGEFPLAEIITQLNGGKNIYNPIDDIRVRDFNLWRKDSSERLAFIKERLLGPTVLDIGCAEGYFTVELAKRGFEVTALDVNADRVAITRYLSYVSSLRVRCVCDDWVNHMRSHPEGYDNVLFLAVLHHAVLQVGVEKALALLDLFKGKVKQMFVEFPLNSDEISWLTPEQKERCKYSFTEEEFGKLLEEHTGLEFKEIWRPGSTRQMFFLTKRG